MAWASTLPVPPGMIARGTSEPTIPLITWVTVPSPPLTTTRSNLARIGHQLSGGYVGIGRAQRQLHFTLHGDFREH